MSHTVLDRPRARTSPPAPRRDPRWVRPTLVGLLAATALLYLWGLSASGDANSYYAAAVQAGSESWKAWFFGALDAASSITVDKPPGSLWMMGLSARVFGFNSWSLLVPQALEGVAAVALLFAAVRRVAGPVAGLAAGALLALTPAAVLIFRFDNPDALLVLLVVAATYAVTRALEDGRTRWLVLAGVALGFGFLTKSGQALLVLPALSVAYLLFGPVVGSRGLGRRLGQLILAAVTLVVSAGWWIVAVLLWPTADRPYIGGSTDNNPLELAFGYNGLGRLFGGAGHGGGGGGNGGGGNSSFGGATGLQRMFTGEFGLEISWLLPAALIGLVAVLWLTRSARRTDRLRAAAVVWGGSLLATGLVFSYMKGTIHPYYSVALAPSIAALVAIAVRELWIRSSAAAHLLLVAMVAVTTGWGVHLLHANGTPTAYVVLAGAVGVIAVLGLLARWLAPGETRRALPILALVTALAIALPLGNWGVRTARTAHTGSIPTAVSGTGSGFGQGGPGGGSGAPGSMGGSSSTSSPSTSSSTSGTAPSGKPGGTSGGSKPSGTAPSNSTGGGMGGGMGGVTTSAALVKALTSSTTTWSAATVGAQSAASLELASDTSVIAIGGFTGSDDAPTLAQFKAWVAEGKIHYFIAGGGGAGGSSAASQITSWVEKNYTKSTIGGTTVYDLTKSSS